MNKEKPPLLSEIRREDYFENELDWLYQRLASDVEALIPENLQYNVRWIIKENFGKEIIGAQRNIDIKFYSMNIKARRHTTMIDWRLCIWCGLLGLVLGIPIGALLFSKL